MKFTGILFVRLGLVFGMAVAISPAEARARELSVRQLTEDVLWWLPEDTQTLIVAQGPFQVKTADYTTDPDALGLERTLQLLTCPVADQALGAEIVKRLRIRTVKLSIEGSRHFRLASGLGMMRYEGAQIVVFRDDLGADGKNLMVSLSKRATKTETISGVPIVTFDGKIVRDEWDLYWGLPGKRAEGVPRPSYVALPRANILVWATDRSYLVTLLGRMATRAATRAFPVSLPEWKQLDARAKLWAIRHYDRKDAPDDEAVGLVFWVDPDIHGSARLKYLSANPAAVRIAQGFWDDPGSEFIRRIQAGGPGLVDITILTEKPNGSRDVDKFLLLLLEALGHGICL